MNSRKILLDTINWDVSPQLPESHCDLLFAATTMIDAWLGGKGLTARLSNRLGGTRWILSPKLWQRLGFHHVEFSTVFLDPQYLTLETVVHEFAHILDNRLGSHPLASIFGGGPSDDLARWLGVEPDRFFPRFFAYGYESEFSDRHLETNPTHYGRSTGPSEDFAESFRLIVMDQNQMAAVAPLRFEWFTTWREDILGIINI